MDWCPYCHQTGGTHDEDCDCRWCDHDCETDCPRETDEQADLGGYSDTWFMARDE